MDAKQTFDEIVRNLLVFLKGQIPSLQNKNSADDVIRQIHGIINFVRNAIVQLEGATFFDPKGTREYKLLLTENENLKKANQRFEESLFLEMNKTQKLSGELEKAATQLSFKEDQVKDAHAKKASIENSLLELKTEMKDKQGEIIGAEKFALERALKIAQEDKAALTKSLEATSKEATNLRNSVVSLESELQTFKEKTVSQDSAIQLSKEIRKKYEYELEFVQNELKRSQREFEERNKISQQIIETNQGTIIELEKNLDALKNRLATTTSGEIIRNVGAASEAKIAYLEKALAEAGKRLEERESVLGKAPEKIENLLKEKMGLEQRIIDLEAIIRRFSMTRMKGTKDDAKDAISFGPEECIFFFEFLSQVSAKLAKNVELSDVKFKAEEALGILLKTHAIETIPSVGSIYHDTIHRAVRAFASNLFEDGMVVFEASRGYRYKEHVIQRAHIWMVKSKFKCSSCQALGRPHDNFCPKCGLELCAPEGTPKRKLLPLPASMDICLPLVDLCIKQEQIQKAREVLEFLSRENPDHPEFRKRQELLNRY